jgi:hypothetical protein
MCPLNDEVDVPLGTRVMGKIMVYARKSKYSAGGNVFNDADN